MVQALASSSVRSLTVRHRSASLGCISASTPRHLLQAVLRRAGHDAARSRKRDRRPARRLRRQAERRIAQVQTRRRQVLRMEPLHHDDDGPALLVIQPCRHAAPEILDHPVSLRVTLGARRRVPGGTGRRQRRRC